MKFGKFTYWLKDGDKKRVWFETDKGLSCLVKLNSDANDGELNVCAHEMQWGKFNPRLFKCDEEFEGAPDADVCDTVLRVFERDKKKFEEDEEALLNLHDAIQRNFQDK